MIYYTSTRGNKRRYTFSEAILEALGKDGGLLMPEEIPHVQLSELQALQGKSYADALRFILQVFQTDLSDNAIASIVSNAYLRTFDTPQVVPVVLLKEKQYLLELWHGPTAAFKDIALQLMPLLMDEARKLYDKKYFHKNNTYINRLILVSTTGDTGKAALEGFKNKESFGVIVFFQKHYVSQLQELLMTTQDGNNTQVYLTDDDVDAVELVIKSVYNDAPFTTRLLKKNQTVLESANSINWARFMPQITYYMHSYLELITQNVINFGEQVDIVVPTGSFGNILSALYAQKMGIPIRKLICASNTNNVVSLFLQTGIYDISGKSIISTPSNSMDTLIAGNIERLLFLITKDGHQVATWMESLHTTGKFEVDGQTKLILQELFVADWVTTKDCLDNIKHIYDTTQYLIDPHTSVAQLVAKRYQQTQEQPIPMLIASTAHWSKFPKSVYKALSANDRPITDLEAIDAITKLIPGIHVPETIKILPTKQIRFKEKTQVTKETLEKIILSYYHSHWKLLY